MTTQTADMLKAYRDRVAALDATFDAGIKKNRKANATIRVVDRDGRPVPGVNLSLIQRTHDFNFGCNGVQIGQKGELNEAYEEEFARLFNLVTTTVCWPSARWPRGSSASRSATATSSGVRPSTESWPSAGSTTSASRGSR